MKCYIVTFQTASSDGIKNAIKSYGTWGKINPNTWAIVSDKTAEGIRNHLLPFLVEGDRLMVIRSGTEAAWSNVNASDEWLQKNL